MKQITIAKKGTKGLFLLALSLITLSLNLGAQSTVIIGANNGANANSATATGYPCPLQDALMTSRAQYLYTQAELTAAGFANGSIINQLGWVTNATTIAGYLSEGYTIYLKNTGIATLSTSSWETGLTQVYGPTNYTYVSGSSGNVMFNTSNFTYTGGALVVEVCGGTTPTSGATASGNPACQWTTGFTQVVSHTFAVSGQTGCGSSSVTNTGTITARPRLVLSKYCAPSYSQGCGLMWLNNVITNGGITNITNNGTGCSSGAYANYFGTFTASQYQGYTLTFSLDAADVGSGWGQGMSMWVDWNQNGSFGDQGELVWSSPYATYPASYSGSFVVPAGAPLGTTRIRIRDQYNAIPTDPCAMLDYGETEDYSFTVVTPPPCSGTPNPGATISSATTLCNTTTTITLTTQNTTLGTGVTYQWQSSPDGTSYTDITAATTATYTTTATATAYYQCAVTCSGNTGYSTPVEVQVIPRPYMTNGTFASLCSSDALNFPLTSNTPSTFTVYAIDNPYVYGEPTWGQIGYTSLFDNLYNTGDTSQVVKYMIYPTDNVAGCPGDTQYVYVTVHPVPVIDSVTPSPSSVCSGSSSTVYASISHPVVISGYCQAGANTIGCNTGDEYISNVSFNGINNTSGCEPGQYHDFTSLISNVTAGSSYPITVTCPNFFTGDQFYVWIDFNQNGDFTDAGEQFVLSSASVSNGTITIPSSARNGYTTMRVRCNYLGGMTPCGTVTYGEVEDYRLNVSLGASNLDYAWSPSTYLSSTTNPSVFAYPITSGITYTVTATSAVGCSSSNSASIFVKTVPVVSSVTATPNTICSGGSSVLTATATLTSTTYCQPTSDCSNGDYIADVSFSTINHNTDACDDVNGSGYSYFASPNPTLVVGTPYTFTADLNTTDDNIAVWIDLDQNGVFDNSTELFLNDGHQSYTNFSTTITLPSTAINGQTRMRVRSYYQYSLDIIDACSSLWGTGDGSTDQGETEDYLVTITGGANAINYTWNPTTNLSSSTGATVTASSMTTTTTYSVTATASASGCSANSSNSVTVTVNPAPVMTSTYTVSICSGSTVSIPLTSTTTSTYTWIATNNPSTTGESTTTQTTSTLSNTITNNTTTAQNVTYTVTPTSSLGCVGTPQIVTVTVYPKGNVNAIANQAFCNNTATSVIAFSGTIAGTTYNWTNNNTNIGLAASGSGNIGSFTATNSTNAPIVATITVTPFANGCQGTTKTFTITVNPTPYISTGASNQSVCNGVINPSSSFTSTVAGATYTWTNSSPSIGLAASGSGPVPSFTAVNTGAFSFSANVFVTPTANGCVGGATSYSITVSPSPSITSSASANVVCVGTVVTLNGGGGNSYTWTGGVTNNVAFVPASTATYTVTGTDFNGCTNTSTQTITVNALPTVGSTASPSATVCAGASVTLNGTGATSYTWTNGVSDGVAFTPASTLTYTVTGTDANSCSNTATRTITVSASPTVSSTVAPAASVCAGTAVTLSGTGATSYTWTGGVTNAVAFTPAATATYTVTGTNAAGCSATSTRTVTVKVLPTVGATASPSTPVCAGTSVTLSGTGATSYVWTGGVTNATAFVPASTATYTVTGTAANGCTATATKTVTVNALPTVGSNATPSSTICAGTAVTLSGTGATSYSWTNGISDGVAFTPGSTTTYTVTGTDANGCVNTASNTITVNSLPSVGATINPSGSAVCAGTSITLSGTGATSYSWTGGVTDGVAFIPASTATYTVTGTDANGCTNTATKSITVNALPTVGSTVTPSATVCAGTAITLSGTGATSYSWTGGVTNGVAFTPASSLTYTVTGTDANGCSATSTKAITVNALPTVSSTVAPAASVCAGTAVTLSGTGATSYTWTGGVTNAVAFTPAATATYTVTGTNAAGCTATSTRTVTVKLLPTVGSTVTPAATVCAGTSVTLSGTGAASYVWTGGVTNAVAFTPASTATYTVTGTAANGCTATATNTVTVNPIPNVTVNSPTICPSQTANLTANGATTYAWSAGATSTGVNTANASPSSTTSYTVTGTTSGCSATAVSTVTVGPSLSITVNSPSICFGQSASLTATGATSYVWSSGATSTGVNTASASPSATTSYTVTGTTGACSGTAVSTVTVNALPTIGATASPSATVCSGTSVTLSGTGATSYSWTGGITDATSFSSNATSTYTVTGTDINGCVNTSSKTITVNALPTVGSTTTPSSTVCAGTSVTLSGTGATSYSWSGGITNGVAFSAASTTTYTVTGTDANGCVNSSTNTITVNALPTVGSTVAPAASVCAGTSVTLGGTGATSYTWSGGVTNAVAFTPAATTTYTVTGTNAAGCSATATRVVTVKVLPTVGSTATPSTPVCAGTSVTLSGNGAVSYVWTGGITNAVAFVPPATTTYTVTGTAANGCTATSTKTITVNPIPNITVNSPTVCPGQTANLTANGGTSYVWSSGAISTGVNTADASPSSTTSYTVTGTTSGCSGTAVSTVTVGPSLAISVNSPSICNGQTASLSATGATSYVWSSGATSTGVNTADAAPTSATSYTVTGTSGACSGTAISTVTVNQAVSSNQNITICSGNVYTIGSSTYTTAGTYNDVLTTIHGCDSTVTTVLTVNQISTTQNITICQGNSYTIGSSTYTTPGTYNDVLTTAGGCDSSVTTVLTVNLITSSQNITICSGNSYTIGSSTYTTPGTYNDVLTTAGGCDSSVTTVLTVNQITSSQNITICSGNSYTIGSSTYTTPGTYNDNLTTAGGCDSLVTTILTVNQITSSQNITICSGNSYTIGSSTYTTPGTYNDNLTTAGGCDSLVTTILTVNPTVTGSQTLTICGGTTITVGSNIYSSSGIYTDILTSSLGCDSTVTTDLTVNPVIAGNQTLTVCSGVSITVGTNSYSSSGTYTDILSSFNGCDSTVTTNLTVNPAITGSQSFTLCFGNSITVGTNTYNSSGTYTDIFTAFSGCDSTVTTNLIVNPAIITNQTITVCPGGSITVGSNTYTTSGIYTDVLTAFNSCDSTVTTNLTVIIQLAVASPSVSICNGSSQILSASGGGGTYYWSPSLGLSGTTGTSVTASPLVNTTYYVTDTVGGCPMIDSTVVTVNPLITVDAGLHQSLCLGDTATFIAIVTGGSGAYAYNWNDGTNNYNTDTIRIVPTTSVTYTLTVTDGASCSVSDTVSFTSRHTDIYGHVTYSGGSVLHGTAVLYRWFNPHLAQFDTIQVSNLDTLTGYYHFTNVYNNNLLVKIFPDTIRYHHIMIPSYYSAHDTVAIWDSTTYFTHTCNAIDTLNIVMVEKQHLGGPGRISGRVTEGVGFGMLHLGSIMPRNLGDPIPTVDVKVGHNPGGQMVTSTTTSLLSASDGGGYYYFDSIPVGCYDIYVDIPGLLRDSVWTICITAADTVFTNINYIADSSDIYPSSSNVLVPNLANIGNTFVVYPNPFRGQATVEYSINKDAEVKLDIYNMLGEKMQTIVNSYQSSGKYKYNINAQNKKLNNGVYFVTLTVGGISSTQRVIVME